jgi:hypothetical protein
MISSSNDRRRLSIVPLDFLKDVKISQQRVVLEQEESKVPLIQAESAKLYGEGLTLSHILQSGFSSQEQRT